MNYIKAIIFFIISLLIFSCNTTEPEQLKPGRRDYTWTVDTIKTFNTPLAKMWGTSPTNVWAVGSGSTLDQTIWHYNGTEWKTDGLSRPISPWCIYGFAEDDIWIGGSDGKIWHYDGSEWSESLSYSEELNYKYYNIYFMDIWGESPNNVYAVGLADSSDVGLGDIRFGIMMHYDGTEWSRVNIAFTEGILKGIKKTSNNYFIYNKVQFSNPDTAKYFEFDGENMKEIYSDIATVHNLTLIDNEVIFSFKKATYTYRNGNFNLLVKNPYPNAWNAVYGRNRKDIIWMMADGLTHYNGTDFEYILNFENIRLRDGIVFDDTVFFVSTGNGDNYIFKGVLK